MERATRLSADQRDNLVAYLDGELPESETRHIDQVLARSEVARHEVEALARTWELLDALPKLHATPEFTQKTITNLRLAEVSTPVTEQPWFLALQKTSLAALWLTTVAFSFWLGFTITRDWVPNPSEELLEDLPVVERLHLYQDVQDVEFLRQLRRNGVFTETNREPLP